MIRMLKTTYYNGKDYKQGEEIKSPDAKTKERWIENGIAEQTNSELFDNHPKQSKFDAMSDEDLSDYAESKGIDISRCRSRESAIAKLEKAE